MPDFGPLVEGIGTALEVVGALIIVVGIALAAINALRGDASERYRTLRHQIGRSILLGLEVLVAADIVRTVAVRPTLEDLAILAGIVAIRTFLSVMLEVEISGRWPWQGSSEPSGS